jgi:uncharacterized SAM-binding protein YcdF (DUF218 family)
LGVGVGLFLLVNLAGQALRPPFETLADWVRLPEASGVRYPLIAAVGVALLANGLTRRRHVGFRRVGILLFATVATLAVIDTALFYVALALGSIRTPAILPASFLVAGFFGALAVEVGRRSSSASRPDAMRIVLAIAALAFALPLVRIVTFGPTRYERRADVAIVFGARVWNDGTPSDALADRIDEAVRLYWAGSAARLLMSGGIDPENGLSEAQVMRARAEAAGVPREAILVDEAGVDTAWTVRNAAERMRLEHLGSALVVTHYYHEPRAKMLFERAGVRAYTVPATMTRRLYKEPYYLLREVGAFWHSFVVD